MNKLTEALTELSLLYPSEVKQNKIYAYSARLEAMNLSPEQLDAGVNLLLKDSRRAFFPSFPDLLSAIEKARYLKYADLNALTDQSIPTLGVTLESPAESNTGLLEADESIHLDDFNYKLSAITKNWSKK